MFAGNTRVQKEEHMEGISVGRSDVTKSSNTENADVSCQRPVPVLPKPTTHELNKNVKKTSLVGA